MMPSRGINRDIGHDEAVIIAAMKVVCTVATVLWVAALWVVIRAQPQTTATPTIDYQRQVHTVLAAKCLGCHSAERRSGGLSLAAYADVLDGGQDCGDVVAGMARLPGEVGVHVVLGVDHGAVGEGGHLRRGGATG